MCQGLVLKGSVGLVANLGFLGYLVLTVEQT